MVIHTQATNDLRLRDQYRAEERAQRRKERNDLFRPTPDAPNAQVLFVWRVATQQWTLAGFAHVQRLTKRQIRRLRNRLRFHNLLRKDDTLHIEDLWQWHAFGMQWPTHVPPLASGVVPKRPKAKPKPRPTPTNNGPDRIVSRVAEPRDGWDWRHRVTWLAFGRLDKRQLPLYLGPLTESHRGKAKTEAARQFPLYVGRLTLIRYLDLPDRVRSAIRKGRMQPGVTRVTGLEEFV